MSQLQHRSGLVRDMRKYHGHLTISQLQRRHACILYVLREFEYKYYDNKANIIIKVF